jgi:parallel beta-helix repeat protein
VDSVGGSDGNAGTTPASPWRTLMNVNSRTFAPGDTVNFKRGSSWIGELTIHSSGAQGNPITYRDYGTGAAPLVFNQGQSNAAIRISSSWVAVQGFLVENTGEAGIRIEDGATHNNVHNNEAANAGIGIEIYGQYNIVAGNYAHDLHMVVNTPGGDDDYGAEGFWIQGPNNEVAYNRCVNCRASSYDYGADGGVVEIFSNGDNSYIHNNYGTASNGFIEVGGGSAQNVRVAYNVSANNYDGFACVHVGGNFNSTVNNFRIENNTIIKTMSQGYRQLDCMSSGVTASQFLFRNNIVYSTIPVADYGSFTHSNNVYFMLNGAGLGYGLGAGEKLANPLLANAGGGDYHLQAGSPAINAGLNLGYTVNFESRPLPQGAAPNVGAY